MDGGYTYTGAYSPYPVPIIGNGGITYPLNSSPNYTPAPEDSGFGYVAKDVSTNNYYPTSDGGVCSSCSKSENQCTSCSEKYTGKTEVMVTIVLNDAPLDVNQLLVGKRYENQTMYDYIKKNYTYVGIGVCKRLNKQMDLWMDGNGRIYGTSKVLPYRYFELNK